jgi:tartrate dehydratase alpha subunit/fumarate hydratase class I-like protein
MPYTFSHSLLLGSASSGLSAVLRAQLFDTAGVDIGSAISTGFVDSGTGTYVWTYNNFPDDFRGGIKFYNNGDPTKTLAVIAVNPQEGEYLDIKVSSLAGGSQSIKINVSNEADQIDITTAVSEETIIITPGVD